MYRIFIIGAGFSKPAGLPLGHELWKLVLEEVHLESNYYEILESDIKSYIIYRKRVCGQEVSSEDIDIEDFISYLDIEHFLKLDGSNTFSEAGNRGQLILKNMIAKVIFKIQKNISSEAIKLYDNFCSSLHETDVIISFNYDTLIEDSLKRINKPFRLLPNIREPVYNDLGITSSIKKVSLLKMHGSINWFDKSYYNKERDILKKDGVLEPYDTKEDVFYEYNIFDIKQLFREVLPEDNPLKDIYEMNNLNKYFNYTKSFVLNAPLIIAPSYSKMLYLNPIKTLWYSFNEVGIFNRSLNIIGFSFPNHDKYLIQIIVKMIINFQEYSKFNQLNIEKKYKKHQLKVIDFQKDEERKIQFQNKLQFIDWSDSIFLSDGFNENAISEIFNPEKN